MSEPMPFRVSRATLGLALALLAACSPPEKEPDSGPSITSLPCSTQAECSSLGFVCDDVRRTCVCTSDEMCADKDGTPYCNAYTGRCVAEVAGCKKDDECGSGEFCDIALRTCRALKNYCETCSQDAECGGPKDHCIRHPDFPGAPPFCAIGCATTADCGNGQACRETEKGNQCVPANGRCSGGVSEFCTPDAGTSCREDRDCVAEPGQVCDQGSRTCVASESGCRAGQSCDRESRKCVAACRVDSECQERYDENFICVRNSCVKSEICFGDGDCGDGRFCFMSAGATSGVCRAECEDNDSCAIGETCSRTAPRRCVPGCESNADCSPTSLCKSGSCESTALNGAQHCQLREACGFREYCQNDTCSKDERHCKPSAGGCTGGTFTTTIFLPRVSISGTLTCPQGSTPLANGNCQIDRCVVGCSSENDCPNGFRCETGFTPSFCGPINGHDCL